MAEYKRIPLEFVEHTELARKSYLDYEQNEHLPNEAETEATWVAERKKLYQVVDRLTPRQRKVYILIVGYGLTEPIIAKKLKITQQAVSKIYIAACKNIEKHLRNITNTF